MRQTPFALSAAPCLLPCLLLALAAAPARAQETAEDEAESQKRAVSHASSLGLDTGRVQRGATALPVDTPDVVEEGGEIEFSSTGFIRAPARVSMGKGQHVDPGVEGGLKTNAPPILADDNYTDWRYLNSMYTPWAEIRLSYGNGTASATLAIAAFDITDSSYRSPRGQLGINEAFITLRLPKLLGPKGGIHWNVGAFKNGYGAAGQYDTGKYDTYLFGATHVAGETLSVSYDLSDDWTLRVEHGIGVKLDMPVFAPTYTAEAHEANAVNPYLPYTGPVQLGGTMVHHAHLGFTWKGMLTLAGHYLSSWTDDARSGSNFEGLPEKDAKIDVYGAELKLTGSRIGSGYLGYSRINLKDPLREAGGLEVLHSIGGYMIRNNFFDDTNYDNATPTGNGSIDTVLFQYIFSVSTFIQGTEKFYGQGPDLLFAIFAMYNHVTSDEQAFKDGANGTDKLKYGADVTYVPMKWLGVGARYDQVNPNMQDNTQTFHAVSPRIVLRSNYISNEEIQLQYSYYSYGDNVEAPWPHLEQQTIDGQVHKVRPDNHALMLSASMWW